MTLEIALVYGILATAVLLFASDRLRLDVVALLALLALAFTGTLEPGEALAGFADPVVLMIAALFVVGDGLFQTGVAARIARLPARLGAHGEVGMLASIMIIVAVLSGFMSSTGTVAVMLPVVMGLAWERGISPSRLLIPLAIAALLGGMLTLIGTAPNIVVSNQLAAAGREPFGFFTFTPVGAVMVAVGVAFVVVAGRRLLPDRDAPRRKDRSTTSIAELAHAYRLPETLFRMRVAPDSPLAGRRLDEAALRKRFGVTVIDLERARERQPAGAAPPERPPRRPRRRRLGEAAARLRGAPGTAVTPETRVAPGDVLLVQGHPDRAAAAAAAEGLEAIEDDGTPAALPASVGLVEIILTPRSRLIGHTLGDLNFREKYRVTVVGVRRLGEPFEQDLRSARFRFGDTLLVQGPWRHIRLLQEEARDFVVAGRPRELDEAERPLGRAPLAALIMGGMLALMTFGVVAPVYAVLLAALAMVLTGCVGVEDAYRSINWESVVLIAAMLPMATALDKTGGLALIVGGLDALLGGRGPLLVLASLFVLTSALSQVISNTATAVLLAPIAMELATRAGFAPEPFLMGIAVAASTAFATPIASPVNVLVLGPGGYRFGDFFRIGVALQALILAATLVVVPRLFPFHG